MPLAPRTVRRVPPPAPAPVARPVSPPHVSAAIKARSSTVLARLDRLSSGWLGALALFGCGLAVYAVRAIAWPLKAGRDLDEYLYAYIQLFDADVLLPWSMLFRTPVTPVVAGAP